LREREAVSGPTSATPVICVSAAGDELVTEASRRGAACCLPKPTDLDVLCETVERFCGG
jgi:FixJ family two-component response regulator